MAWFDQRGARYGSVLGERFGPRPFYDLSTEAGVTSLQGHEAVIGARVKVLGSDRRPEMRGMLGTIEERFGHEDALALDGGWTTDRRNCSGLRGWRRQAMP